jgi:hypothetical protein
MNNCGASQSRPGPQWPAGVCVLWLLLLACLGGAGSRAGEVTETQVKALCILNFAKYVSWPDDAFAETNAPIRIGIVGSDEIRRELAVMAAGKVIGGRTVQVIGAEKDSDWRACHVLFLAGDKVRAQEAMRSVHDLPVLSVGEGGHFISTGGVIRLAKKDNKIRFEINLNSARRARLQISSKLLSLADVVEGKEQP